MLARKAALATQASRAVLVRKATQARQVPIQLYKALKATLEKKEQQAIPAIPAGRVIREMKASEDCQERPGTKANKDRQAAKDPQETRVFPEKIQWSQDQRAIQVNRAMTALTQLYQDLQAKMGRMASQEKMATQAAKASQALQATQVPRARLLSTQILPQTS
jgi:hypothetical protein